MDEENYSSMEGLLKWIREKNEQYLSEQIEFTDYCREKMKQRNIEENSILSILNSKEDLFYAELQKRSFHEKIEKRYKLVYRISSKYSFIIIVAYYKKNLKVINVIKTSKDFKIKWRKKILK